MARLSASSGMLMKCEEDGKEEDECWRVGSHMNVSVNLDIQFC